jgi:hypothetical protein
MTETPNFTPDVEAAAQRIKETSDRVLALSKENGLVWLERTRRCSTVCSSSRRTPQGAQFRLGRKICVNASRPDSSNVRGIPRCSQRSTEVAPQLDESRRHVCAPSHGGWA